jgi:hypothetical protein
MRCAKALAPDRPDQKASPFIVYLGDVFAHPAFFFFFFLVSGLPPNFQGADSRA